MQNFVYIPAEGERPAKWLNLSVLLKITEHPNGALTIWNQAEEEVGNFQNRQAAVLRLHLQGRAMSHQMDAEPGGISDADYFDRHTREPQLPNIPDPAIIPAAVDFEERLSAQGTVA